MATQPSDPQRPVSPQELEGDAIRPGNPLFGVVWVNAQRMSGAPCFFGTRVPVKNLFDYIRAGRTLDEFVGDFPGVSRVQVESVLARAPEFFTPRGHAA